MNHIKPLHTIILSLVVMIGFQTSVMAETLDRTETRTSRKESRESRHTKNRDVRDLKVFKKSMKTYQAAVAANKKNIMKRSHLSLVNLMEKEMNQTKAKILAARTEIRESSRDVRKGKRDKALTRRTTKDRKTINGKSVQIRDDRRDLNDDKRDLAVLQKRYQRQRGFWATARKLDGATNPKAAKAVHTQFVNTLIRDNMANRKEVREDRREIREDRRQMKNDAKKN